VLLSIRADEPSYQVGPPRGAVINFTRTADGLIHTISFTSSPRQTIAVPTAEIPAGQTYFLNTLRDG